MKTSKPTVENYTLKWELSDVIHFQTGYESAPNKGDYLKSITKENKPNIDKRFDAFAANFLNEIGLGFKEGSAGEEVAAQATKGNWSRSLSL